MEVMRERKETKENKEAAGAGREYSRVLLKHICGRKVEEKNKVKKGQGLDEGKVSGEAEEKWCWDINDVTPHDLECKDQPNPTGQGQRGSA